MGPDEPGGSRLPTLKHTQSISNAPIEGGSAPSRADGRKTSMVRIRPIRWRMDWCDAVAPVTDVASVKAGNSREEDPVDSEQALEEECGCAPSPRERRLLWPAMSR